MPAILTTLALIIAVIASAALVAYTGSLRAAGAFGLVAVLVGIWCVKQAEWNSVRSLLADIQRWRSGD